MSITHVMRLNATPDEVAELLTSERYNVTIQEEREDVVKCSYRPGSDTESELRYEVHQTSYKRTKTGGMDKSGTTDGKTVYRFDKASRTLHWEFVGEEKKVNVSGVTRIFPDGSGARLERQVDIVVKIPIVGKGIQKLIEAEFKKGYGKLEGQINRLLKG